MGDDKNFIMKDMPSLYEFFHYRVVDVSTIKELAFRWYPQLPYYKKKLAHRALGDIEESIEELKYLRKHLFIL